MNSNFLPLTSLFILIILSTNPIQAQENDQDSADPIQAQENDQDSANPIQAQENDQETVIGITLNSSYGFFRADDNRNANFPDGLKVKYAHAFFEWYLPDNNNIGFGFRRAYTGGISHPGWKTILITSNYFTAHYLPWISPDRYFRLGTLLGIGKAEYYTKFSSSGPFLNEEGSTKGDTIMVGGYLDWGGEGFGARLGINLVATDFAPLKSNAGTTYQNIDGSGMALYFDVRWAFMR